VTPSFWRRIPGNWKFILRIFARRPEDDVDAELRFHFEARIAELAAQGVRPDAARATAEEEFGDVHAVRERLRDIDGRIAKRRRRADWWEGVAQELRYAGRTLVRAPAFTAAAVVTLALGIGANTTMFSVVDTLLFKPPAHVREPGGVVRIYFASSDASAGANVTSASGYGTFVALRDHVRGFESVAAYFPTRVSVGTGIDAHNLSTVLATPSFFTVLGVRPALGRFFADDEERADKEPVAILGYGTWRATYAGDSGVIGRSIIVAGARHTIIGVAPGGFTGVDLRAVDLWLPIGEATRLFDPGALTISTTGDSYWLYLLGRKRADVSDNQVAAQATAAFLDNRRPNPMFERFFSKTRLIVGPILEGRGPAANSNVRVATWLGAVALIVLLIACANVASLMLARGVARSREMAIRLSLGSTRARLARQLVVEGVLLAALGAAGALLVARWSAATLTALFIPDAAPRDGPLDWRLWLFVALVAMGAGLLASLPPALASMRQDFDAALKVGVAGLGAHRSVLRRALVSGQVALTLMLLIGSGLFITSLRNVLAHDVGVDTAHVLYASGDLTSLGIATPDINARYATMLAQVQRLPGVRSASVSDGAPFAGAWGVWLRVPGGKPEPPGAASPFGQAVGPHYFETMGTTLREGRLFTDADQSPSSHVAIIDERTAHHYWPAGHAVGACAHLDSDSTPCTEIVGIVANAARWLITEQQEWYSVYVPLPSGQDRRVTLMEIRAKGDPADIVDAVRRAMQSTAPDTPYASVQPLGVSLEWQIRPWRLGARMFTAFGLLALVLAAVGLYGLLSFMVAQRTREIGVRKALGAPDHSVVGLVVRNAITMTAGGVLVGVLAALPAGRLIAGQLYGVSSHDARVFVLGAVVLILVGLVASYVPARRAARIDPMDALRSD
jgi:putative ABC transport system permease protein